MKTVKIIETENNTFVAELYDGDVLISPRAAERSTKEELVQLCTEIVCEEDGIEMTGMHPFIYTPE